MPTRLTSPPTTRRGSPRNAAALDRKSTRLNSSHANISYAVFCLEKKNTRLNSSHANISYAVFCLKKKSINTHAHNYNTTCSIIQSPTVCKPLKSFHTLIHRGHYP